MAQKNIQQRGQIPYRLCDQVLLPKCGVIQATSLGRQQLFEQILTCRQFQVAVQFHLGQGTERFVEHDRQIYAIDGPMFILDGTTPTGAT